MVFDFVLNVYNPKLNDSPAGYVLSSPIIERIENP